MCPDVVPDPAARRPGFARALPALASFTFGGLAIACSGAAHQAAIEPPPARDTHAALAGNLCSDNHCSCRGDTGDGGVGVPDNPTRKRYEIRLGSPNELWLTINKTIVLYKSPERAEDCFYVDLPTGDQAIELRAEKPEGVSAALQIHELGTRTHSWYDTFAFTCGVPGVCSLDELDSNKAELTAPRKIFDRCGTTRIKGISWDHGKAPDQEHPSELVVRLTLDIYKRAATKLHGDPTCAQRGVREPTGSDAPSASEPDDPDQP